MYKPGQQRVPKGRAGGGRFGSAGPGGGSGTSAKLKRTQPGQAQAAFLGSLSPAELAALQESIMSGRQDPSTLAMRILVADEIARRRTHPGEVRSPSSGGKGKGSGRHAAAHKPHTTAAQRAAKKAAAHKASLDKKAAAHKASLARKAAAHQAALQRAAARAEARKKAAAAKAAAALARSTRPRTAKHP